MLGCCSNSKIGGDDDDIGGGYAGQGRGMEGELEESEGGVSRWDRVGTVERSAGSGRNSGGGTIGDDLHVGNDDDFEVPFKEEMNENIHYDDDEEGQMRSVLIF
ncbi:uncharacterized protein A4U43_C08F16430 [Asparagus officinalis]|nr:uncharacterized protein A4U43_C08F16430 [Asparagus officinalis]